MNTITAAAAEADGAKPTADAEELSLDYWKNEIQAAAEREEGYRKDAVNVIEIYEGIRKETEQYNILYSNVDTMQPALYNSTPRPVVTRRFKGDDDLLAKCSANLMQRLLTYLLQNEEPGYATFDELMSDSTLSALLVSRGLVRFKYHAELAKAESGEAQEPVESGEEPGAQETDSEGAAPEEITYECVYGEQVPWNNFLHGYAKYWKDVPWVGFIHLMTMEEFKEQFPDAKVDMEKLRSAYGSSDTSDRTVNDAGKPDGTGAIEAREVRNLSLIPVYELWHKGQGKVYFYSEFSAQYLKDPVEDPLQLRGFFPCPRPLNFMQRLSTLVPTLLYTMYQKQSEELNRITVRIQKLIVACKLRGAYDSTVDEMAKILEAEDNAMIALQDSAVLYSQNGSIDRAIWLMPIKDIVPVLQQLYTQRQQIKQIIFEITGLADIMRGSTQASETLGAQEIKNQWGTLRLKRSQKLVQRYVRDCLQLLGELAVTKLQPERIRAMTQSDLPSEQDKQIAQMQLQQQQQAAAMQPQVPGQPPVQPPEPDPNVMAMLQMPSFEQCLQTLKDDLTRSYKIDIETNSTIDDEATEDKQDITDALTALGQTLQSVGPLVQQQILPFEAAKALMLTVCRKFKFGTEIEDQINAMKAPPPPQPEGSGGAPSGPPPEQVAAESQAAIAKANADMQKIQMQMQADAREHEFRMEELQMQRELNAAKHAAAMQQAMTPKPAPAAPAPRASKKGP
jgi:hypothetical protein